MLVIYPPAHEAFDQLQQLLLKYKVGPGKHFTLEGNRDLSRALTPQLAHYLASEPALS